MAKDKTVGNGPTPKPPTRPAQSGNGKDKGNGEESSGLPDPWIIGAFVGLLVGGVAGSMMGEGGIKNVTISGIVTAVLGAIIGAVFFGKDDEEEEGTAKTKENKGPKKTPEAQTAPPKANNGPTGPPKAAPRPPQGPQGSAAAQRPPAGVPVATAQSQSTVPPPANPHAAPYQETEVHPPVGSVPGRNEFIEDMPYRVFNRVGMNAEIFAQAANAPGSSTVTKPIMHNAPEAGGETGAYWVDVGPIHVRVGLRTLEVLDDGCRLTYTFDNNLDPKVMQAQVERFLDATMLSSMKTPPPGAIRLGSRGAPSEANVMRAAASAGLGTPLGKCVPVSARPGSLVHTQRMDFEKVMIEINAYQVAVFEKGSNGEPLQSAARVYPLTKDLPVTPSKIYSLQEALATCHAERPADFVRLHDKERSIFNQICTFDPGATVLGPANQTAPYNTVALSDGRTFIRLGDAEGAATVFQRGAGGATLVLDSLLHADEKLPELQGFINGARAAKPQSQTSPMGGATELALAQKIVSDEVGDRLTKLQASIVRLSSSDGNDAIVAFNTEVQGAHASLLRGLELAATALGPTPDGERVAALANQIRNLLNGSPVSFAELFRTFDALQKMETQGAAQVPEAGMRVERQVNRLVELILNARSAPMTVATASEMLAQVRQSAGAFHPVSRLSDGLEARMLTDAANCSPDFVLQFLKNVISARGAFYAGLEAKHVFAAA